MSFPQDAPVPQQPPVPLTSAPAVQTAINSNQPPYSNPSQGYGQQFPAQFYPGAPMQPGQANKPPRKQLWIGLGLGFAAGIIVCVLGAGIGSAVASATESHALQKAVDACNLAGNSGVSVGDEGASLTIDTEGEEDSTGASLDDLACILGELKVPDSVVAKMDATSAMQGRQSAAWDSVEASWTYHPDSGVKVIITHAKN